ncbi:hypothetical protein FE257_003108 [Aspergillus nanangensis]|uniref:Carboxylic ester hydrolase n=1 Tax=Aspergillus nanangensis TaxID=2582783 RepID=A0AAD4CBX9_ASPNN|nr:hypothetical protein FE257_003108 [Aspergillus nanangensis]
MVDSLRPHLRWGYKGVSRSEPDELELVNHADPAKSLLSAETSLEYHETDKQEPTHPHWIPSIYLCAKISAAVLVLNLIFIAVAAGLASRYPENELFASSAVIYRGSCTVARRSGIVLHLMINVLSTATLAASSNCMQTLVAPTRREVDQAHSRRKWLAIGESSLRSLLVIPKSRLAIWLVLVITATPFHLLYNCMIFESLAAHEYGIVVGPKDLNPPDIRNLTTPTLQHCFGRPASYFGGNLTWNELASDFERQNYEHLSSQQCTDFTNQNAQAGVKFLMVLSNDLSVHDGGDESIFLSLVAGGNPQVSERNTGATGVYAVALAGQRLTIGVSGDDTKLYYDQRNFTTHSCHSTINLPDQEATAICDDAEKLLDWAYMRDFDRGTIDEYIRANTTSRIAVQDYSSVCFADGNNTGGEDYSLDSCIVITADKTCELLYSPLVSLVIALTTFAKVVAMVLAARLGRSRPPPLLTIGDAIASFIAKPDPTTARLCWASRRDFSPKHWKVPHGASVPESDHQWKKLSRPKRWMEAPSIMRRLATTLAFAAIIAIGAVFLQQAILGEQRANHSSAVLQQWWKDDLSSDNYSLVTFGHVGGSPALPMLAFVAIANIPHLVLTCTYYCYNNLLTSMLAAAEYTSSTFSSLILPNINVLAVDTAVAEISWPTQDLTNAFAPTKNGSTEVCQVTVQYTHPGWNDTINTWIWLPVKSWNQRFVGMGGGGWVTGTPGALSQPISEGYSAASTDGGHSESASTESWAIAGEGNLHWPLLQDFSSVALDEAASLGKLATRGRQGHMMAQRFPNQYDGILAGAPAINWDKFIPAEYWPQLMMRLLDYYPPACELDAITQFAISACDELDGVLDGIISMPGLCDFDPFKVVGKRVQCSTGSDTLEISHRGAQLAAAIWAGAEDSTGSFLWYGMNHEAPLTGLAGTNCSSRQNCNPAPFSIATDWMTTILSKNPSLDLSTIGVEEFGRLFRTSISEFQSVIGTRDHDLTDFKNAGGKMITWHGMKDQLIFYNGTVDYYRHVLELDPSAHGYYRFFPAPGVEHCGGGPGWYPGDSFRALVDWVEKGKAPDTLFALSTPTVTGSAALPARTAYLCPFPKVMTYVGGNPNKASSFTCK